MEGVAAAWRCALLVHDTEGNEEGGTQDGRQAPRQTGSRSQKEDRQSRGGEAAGQAGDEGQEARRENDSGAHDEGQRREGKAKARDRRQKGSVQSHNRRSQRCVAPFSSDIDRSASGGLASPHTCQAIRPQHTTTSARDASCTRPRTGASSSGIIARGAIQDRHQTVADLKQAATPGSSSPDFTCRRVPIGGLRAISIASSGEPIGASRGSGHPIGPRIDNVTNDDSELIERLNSAYWQPLPAYGPPNSFEMG